MMLRRVPTCHPWAATQLAFSCRFLQVRRSAGACSSILRWHTCLSVLDRAILALYPIDGSPDMAASASRRDALSPGHSPTPRQLRHRDRGRSLVVGYCRGAAGPELRLIRHRPDHNCAPGFPPACALPDTRRRTTPSSPHRAANGGSRSHHEALAAVVLTLCTKPVGTESTSDVQLLMTESATGVPLLRLVHFRKSRFRARFLSGRRRLDDAGVHDGRPSASIEDRSSRWAADLLEQALAPQPKCVPIDVGPVQDGCLVRQGIRQSSDPQTA